MANPLKSMQRTREEYRSMDRLDRRRFWSDSILNNALYILMFVFVVYTAIKNKNFLAPGSIVNILSLVAASLPMALGIAGCIVLTGTDLSGGRVVGLTSAIAGALLQDRTISRKFFSSLPEITGGWILLTILCVVLIGAIIGMVNGFFVAKFSLHPFIVTLATQLITYGLILIFFMLNENNGQPVSGLSQEYKNVISAPMIQFTTKSGAPISIPWYVLYAVIFVFIMWFIWNKTSFGKNMFAVGSNADAARVSGVNVFWTTVLVHTLAGAMYGVTGFIEGALAVNPDIDTIGLLYDLSQDSSAQAIADAKAFCDSKGIQYIEKNGTTTAEVQMAAEALIAAGVKAVFTPTDNTVMTAELSIYETFTEAGVMHFTGADSFALNGAFVGYGVDYVQLGEATADMVAEILCDGKTTADLPYQTFDNGIVTINTETAAALGFEGDKLGALKEAFKPSCTEIVEVTTAESFS